MSAGIASRSSPQRAPSAPDSGGLSTLNADGSRRWLRPRPARGRHWRRRRAVAYTLIGVFTLIPYLRMNGKPLILLDIVQRQFTFFGVTFLPTDTVLLALLLVGVFVTIFLATAVLGRVWCGWACPQTVYMEFLYRPIERLFEGEPGRRRPLISDRGVAKVVKFVVYLAVSMILAHTFLAYFVGVDQLVRWVQRSPLEHPTSFLVMAGVTGLMLFDFGFFREQMCIVACPYGRFQSVMLDRNSLVVSYDQKRGEPRGKARRPRRKVCGGGDGDCASDPAGEGDGSRRVPLSVLNSPTGRDGEPGGRLAETFAEIEGGRSSDCVDCLMCVQTCPTGIDIRNGLQMECIACAQCIDACDAVMTKLGRPTGLIRYSTQSRTEGEARRRVRPRLILYPALLAIVGGLFVALLLTRSPVDVTVLRGPGRPFNELNGGLISNQVKIRLTNRTDLPERYRFELVNAPGAELILENNPMLAGGGERISDIALIVAPRELIEGGAREIFVRITSDAGYRREVRYRLLGPAQTPRGAPAAHQGNAPR